MSNYASDVRCSVDSGQDLATKTAKSMDEEFLDQV